MVSRVVPGMSWTTARSSPIRRLNSVDLPTLGRPTMATDDAAARRRRRRGDSVLAVVGHASSVGAVLRRVLVGRAAAARRRASSRSPVPRPCRALTGNGLAQAEAQQLPDLALAAGVVDLVGHEQDRLARAAEQLGDLGVLLGDAGDDVDHEQHDVGVGDGPLGLAADLVVEVAARGQPAAGVDEAERAAQPVGVDVLAVAGDARAAPRRWRRAGRRCG